MMAQHLHAFALLVDDYDRAIDYYCNTLGFRLVEDTLQSPEKRWVLVAPKGAGDTHILLARASSAEQSLSIGNQSGGRVFLFLHTDDFDGDYRTYRERGVDFTEQPRHEPYGKVVVFRDLYGNRWDLMQLIA